MGCHYRMSKTGYNEILYFYPCSGALGDYPLHNGILRNYNHKGIDPKMDQYAQ